MNIRIASLSAWSLLQSVTMCLSGCGTEIHQDMQSLGPAGPHPELHEISEWVVESMTKDSAPQTIVQGSRITIAFTPVEFRGHTGCNHFSGTYTVDEGGAFRIGELSCTEMGCEPKLAAQEAAVLTLLGRVKQLKVNKSQLSLTDGTADNQLTCVPFAPVALPLRGTRWSLTHFEQSDEETVSAMSVLENHPIHLRIDTEQVSGNGGCNSFTAAVSVPGDGRISFQAPASTKKSCGEDADAQESRFFDELPRMTEYSIRENRLVLSNETSALHFEGTPESDQ